MAKKHPPKIFPAVGDRVCLKGAADLTGTLREIGKDQWTKVEWDQQHKRCARYVHLMELDKITH